MDPAQHDSYFCVGSDQPFPTLDEVLETERCYYWLLREKEYLKRDLESSWAQTLAALVALQAWCFVYIYFFIPKMEKKKTLDTCADFLHEFRSKMGISTFSRAKVEKTIGLENEAHF